MRSREQQVLFKPAKSAYESVAINCQQTKEMLLDCNSNSCSLTSVMLGESGGLLLTKLSSEHKTNVSSYVKISMSDKV